MDDFVIQGAKGLIDYEKARPGFVHPAPKNKEVQVVWFPLTLEAPNAENSGWRLNAGACECMMLPDLVSIMDIPDRNLQCGGRFGTRARTPPALPGRFRTVYRRS